MPSTYEPIATVTVSGSSTNLVTFSSIPGTYTDLVAVCSIGATTTGVYHNFILNSDTGNNYSRTQLFGNGSTASSYRASNEASAFFDDDVLPNASNTYGVFILNFQNYVNTTTNKTVISRYNNSANRVGATVNLWRNTAAINDIKFSTTGAFYSSGSTFTLYGIKAA
jgi:hypothetical protein